MNYPQETLIYNGKKVTFIWMEGVPFDEYEPIIQCYGIVIHREKEILLARKTNSSDWTLPGALLKTAKPGYRH